MLAGNLIQAGALVLAALVGGAITAGRRHDKRLLREREQEIRRLAARVDELMRVIDALVGPRGKRRR